MWTWFSLLVMILPFFLGLGSVKTDALEVPEDVNVTITKRDGNQVGSGELVNGAGFTAYNITADFYADYTTYKTANPTSTMQDFVNSIVTSSDQGESYISGATETVDMGITGAEADGKTPVKVLPMKTAGDYSVYYIKETSWPAGAVQSAQPLILVLPIMNEAGDEFETDLDIRAKNILLSNELEFIKVGDNNAPLNGAKFILLNAAGEIYNVETGVFEADPSPTNNQYPATYTAISGPNGRVTFTGVRLLEGDYYFKEVESDVATSEEQTGDADELHHFDKDRQYPFTVTYDGEEYVIAYDFDNTKVKNFLVPNPEKTASDDDAQLGETITYTITQTIPEDIVDYTRFILTDNYDAALQLESTLADVEVTIGGTTVTLGEIADITEAAGSFVLTFKLAELTKYPGATLSFDVDMKVIADTDVIENDLEFDNNFYPKEDKETIYTYKLQAIKKDAYTNATLAGAVFKLQNSAGEFLQQTGTPLGNVWGTEELATEFPVDANGVLQISGLESGTYELVEIVAPTGYVLAETTFPVTITPVGGEMTEPIMTEIDVPNKPKGSLPGTGGNGIVYIIVAGTLLAGGAGFYFIKRRNYTA